MVGFDNGYTVYSVDQDLGVDRLVEGRKRLTRRSNMGCSFGKVKLDDEGGEEEDRGKKEEWFLIGDDSRGLIYLGSSGSDENELLFNASIGPIYLDTSVSKVERAGFGISMNSVYRSDMKENIICIGAPELNTVTILRMGFDKKGKLVQRIRKERDETLNENRKMGFGKHCLVTREYLTISMTNDVFLYSWDRDKEKYENRTSMKSKLDRNAINITAFEGGETALDENRLLTVSPLGTFSFEKRDGSNGLKWEFINLIEEPTRPKAVAMRGKTAVVSGDHRAVVFRWDVTPGTWRPAHRLVDGRRKTKFIYGRSVAISGRKVVVGEPAYRRILMWDLDEAPAPTAGPTPPPTPNVLPLPEDALQTRICFDAEARVRVRSEQDKSSRVVAIANVTAGDFVESWTSNGASTWSRVFLTQHSERHSIRSNVYDIQWSAMQKSGKLRVSTGHYIQGVDGIVVPEHLQVGDTILIRGGITATVAGITLRRDVKVVNIHTMNDVLVVDDTHATCFPKVLVAGSIDYYKYLWWSMWILKGLYFIAGPDVVAKVDYAIHQLAPLLTSPILGSTIVLVGIFTWVLRKQSDRTDSKGCGKAS